MLNFSLFSSFSSPDEYPFSSLDGNVRNRDEIDTGSVCVAPTSILPPAMSHCRYLSSRTRQGLPSTGKASHYSYPCCYLPSSNSTTVELALPPLSGSQWNLTNQPSSYLINPVLPLQLHRLYLFFFLVFFFFFSPPNEFVWLGLS